MLIALWMLTLLKKCSSLQNDPPILCDIPFIQNGQVINNNYEKLKVGDKLDVKCGIDYDLSRIEQSVCQSDRAYIPEVPECNPKPCPAPNIANGSASPPHIQPGDPVTIICDDDYILSSSIEVTCLTDTVFTTTLPSCIARNCNSSAEVANGQITGPTPHISPGSILMVQCDQGYKKAGSLTITCVTFNQFDPVDGLDSICTTQDCVPPTIPNGNVVNTGTIRPGDTITITCDEQYLETPPDTVVQCVTLNKYSPEILPKCQAQPCPERTITSGRCPETAPSHTFQITCDVNYEKSDNQVFTCVSGDIYQPADAEFPKCKAKDCTIKPIKNGEIIGKSTLSPGESATLQCGSDYQPKGNLNIICVAGTKFQDATLPSCEPFPCPLPLIENATITAEMEGSDIRAGSQLTIICNEPYVVAFSTPVFCVTKSIFNPHSLPECIQTTCTKPTIENGDVTGPDPITPGSTLIIQCKAGYKMSHDEPVKCYSKEIFDRDMPKCNAQNCPKPPAGYIPNSEIIGDMDPIAPGDTFTVVCNGNYTRSGSEYLTCKTASIFDEEYPVCNANPCSTTDIVIANAKVTNSVTEIQPGDQIMIQCNPGYTLSDTTEVQCVAGTEYSADLPTCKGEPCPSVGLPQIENGVYSRDQWNSGDTITVDCEEGYERTVGDAVCQTKTTFSGTLPTCTAQNCTVGDVENGFVEDNGDIEPGKEIKITCEKGYELRPGGITRCVTDMVYDPPMLPTCSVVPCPLPIIPHGSVTNPSDLESGVTLTVKCDPNYELMGTEVKCVSGEVYSAEHQMCDATACNPKPTISNGKVTNMNYINPGDAVVVECDTNYKLSHVNTSVCVTNTSYKPSLPTCNDKDCGIPTIPNGVISPVQESYSPGTALTLTCGNGYDADGPTTFTCERANVFSPSLPSCAPQVCPKPVVLNGTVSPATDPVTPGNKITVSCTKKYDLIGSDVVECVALHTFSPGVPSCKAKDCPVPDIPNGLVESGTMIPGEELRVTCSDGYDKSSHVKVTCVSDDIFEDGTSWGKSVVPSCNARSCSKTAIVIEHGLITNPSNEILPDSEIQIKCDTGYDLTPADPTPVCTTQTSKGNTYYPVDLPKCEPRNCAAPDITNGKVTSPDPIIPGARIDIQCTGGYTSNGTTALFCVTDDQYSADFLPACIKNCVKQDDLIPEGHITGPTTLRPGNTITIKCREGFEFGAPTEIVKCVTDTEYDPPAPTGCTAVPCPVPSIPRATINNVFPLDPDDILTVSCPEEYQISVSVSIICVSGTVYDPAVSEVVCKEKPCPVPTILNGYVYNNADIEPNKELVYTCNTGYYSDVASRVYCNTSTIFNPTTPKCQPVNCITPQITDATITPAILTPGTHITISCSGGKESDVPDGVIFSCVTENVFSLNPLPKCVAVSCLVPTIPHSASINGGATSLAPESTLSVKCDSNYRYKAVPIPVVCVSGTVWTSQILPQCTAKPCIKPVIPNGIVSTQDVIYPGSVLELNCGTGYLNPAHRTFVCVSHNKFDTDIFPSCQTTEYCIVPTVAHGTVLNTPKPDEALQIMCDTGYQLDSTTNFTCVTSDIFHPNSKVPECKPEPCLDDAAIVNGNITGPSPVITPGSNLTIQCIAGYAINSHIMPQCIHTSLYEPALRGIQCVTAKNCTFGYVADGTLAEWNVAPGIPTTLTCNNGYSPLPQDGQVFCVVDKIIYPPDFKCYRTECSLPSVTKGYVKNTVLYQGDTVLVECQSGYYNPYIAAPVTCIGGDVFSLTTPLACLKVEKCTIPDVNNGAVEQGVLPIGEVVRLKCNAGYYDPYNGVIRCTDMGTISLPNIGCQYCDKTFSNTDGQLTSPMFGSNGNYPNNTHCTYHIIAKDKKQVQLTLSYVNMEYSDGCYKDSLSFFDGNDTSAKLLDKICSNEGSVKRNVREIRGTADVMTVLFVSDGENTGRGFSLGYATYSAASGSNAVKIAVGVLVPVLLIILLAILLFIYLKYYRSTGDKYGSPHKNFHWNEGGPIDNAYFHYIANGGGKPPPSLQEKLEAVQPRTEEETDSVVSTNSRVHLTKSNVLYSSIKLGLAPQSPHSKSSSQHTLAAQSSSQHTLAAQSNKIHTTYGTSSNYNDSTIDKLEKYNHKRALEGLGLSEKDFKLNIPSRYGHNLNNLSASESDEDSFARTALEDTLLDGDPLQHTILTEEVLRSPETMRALEKFRAGARKTGPSRHEDPNSDDFEMKQQNRLVSERQLAAQRHAYDAGYRRPLPPNITKI